MTHEDVGSLKAGVIPLPSLFASGAGADVTQVPATDDNGNVSFSTGYTVGYENSSGNTKAIERGKMNWLLKAFSQASFFGQAGIRYTFNSGVCSAIGGYPKDAVLAHDTGNAIRYVQSLVDNNAVDFVTYGVDGVNWKYIDTFDSDAIYPDYGYCSYIISTSIPPNTTTIANFGGWTRMPVDGWIYTQFKFADGVTTYIVLGPADGSIPTVTFSGDEYIDMIPDSENSKSYTAILLGNNLYQNKNLLPVKKGTMIGIYGKNTAVDSTSNPILIPVNVRLYGTRK